MALITYVTVDRSSIIESETTPKIIYEGKNIVVNNKFECTFTEDKHLNFPSSDAIISLESSKEPLDTNPSLSTV